MKSENESLHMVDNMYQLNKRVRPNKGLWALVILLMVSTIAFALLALRNARMVSCQDITWDQYRQERVCELTIKNGTVQ